MANPFGCLPSICCSCLSQSGLSMLLRHDHLQKNRFHTLMMKLCRVSDLFQHLTFGTSTKHASVYL